MQTKINSEIAPIAAAVARVSLIVSLMFAAVFITKLIGFSELSFPLALIPGFLGGWLGFYFSSLIEIRPAQHLQKDQPTK